MKFAFTLCLIVVALGSLSVASVQGSFQRTFQVSGPVNLEVLTHSGDITVHSGASGSVIISGKIHVSDSWFHSNRQNDISELEKNPPLRQSGNAINIDYVNVRDISIDYDITVPSDTTLHTRTNSGDQNVSGLTTNLDLQSDSGDMRLSSLSGGAKLHTGSGNVDAHDISGAITAEAGSGDLHLETRGGGDIRVRTGSGDIELRGVKGGLWVEAGSGDVSVEGTQSSAWEVRTGSGNVDLQLPNNAGFDLQASTGSGRVVVDRPLTMTVQGDLEQSHRSMNGQVGGGGPRLLVHTGSGDVNIR
jgi:DUF4097 and DUF4098 domain-containing protein YvlB